MRLYDRPTFGGPGSAAFAWFRNHSDRLAAAEAEVKNMSAFYNDADEEERHFIDQARRQGFIVSSGEHWRQPHCEGKVAWWWSAKRKAEDSAECERIKRAKELLPERQATLERKREARRHEREAEVRRQENRDKRERRLIKMKQPLLRVLEDELVGKRSVRIGGYTFMATDVEYEPQTGQFILFYWGPDGCEDRKVLPQRILRAAEARLPS